MKKTVLFAVLLMMITALVPVHAETHIDEIAIDGIQIEQVTINVGMEVFAETNDECAHADLVQISDNQSRCLYSNESSHVWQVYHVIKCRTCNDFPREVLVSESEENHNYEVYDYYCDPVSMTHTTWKMCSGCKRRSTVSRFCRGYHEEYIDPAQVATPPESE